MKKISDKLLDQELNDFVNLNNKQYVKQKCFEKIFKTPMSPKKYAEFIRKIFEINISPTEIKKWRVEFEKVSSNGNINQSN